MFTRMFFAFPEASHANIAFTLEAEGENGIWSLHLRNGVLVTGEAEGPAADHIRLTRHELAEFILGRRALGSGAVFEDFDVCLDRSGLKPMDEVMAAFMGTPDEERRLTVAGEQ